jgi:hypothetical protein
VFNIGDFLFNIGDFVFEIHDFVFNIGDFLFEIHDFVFNIDDFVFESGGVPLTIFYSTSPIFYLNRAAFRPRFCVQNRGFRV